MSSLQDDVRNNGKRKAAGLAARTAIIRRRNPDSSLGRRDRRRRKGLQKGSPCCVECSQKLKPCAYRKHHRGRLATESTTFRSIFCGGAAREDQSCDIVTLEKSDGVFGRHRKLCPKNLCRLRGSPQNLGNNLGTIAAKKPAKIEHQDTRKDETNQLHARFLPDSGSGYPGSSPGLPANLSPCQSMTWLFPQIPFSR